MINMKIIVPIFLLVLLFAGCGETDKHQAAVPQQTVDDAAGLCEILGSNALAKMCRVNPNSNSVDVMIDSSDEQAGRNTCDLIAGKLKPITAEFKASWKLQIFSVYRDDKPLASCDLR
ncbi:MAG: hypothetical protein WCD45_03680 [Gallionella sp.]